MICVVVFVWFFYFVAVDCLLQLVNVNGVIISGIGSNSLVNFFIFELYFKIVCFLVLCIALFLYFGRLKCCIVVSICVEHIFYALFCFSLHLLKISIISLSFVLLIVCIIQSYRKWFLLTLTIGNLVLRMIYEFSLVLLSIHENVAEINKKIKK